MIRNRTQYKTYFRHNCLNVQGAPETNQLSEIEPVAIRLTAKLLKNDSPCIQQK